MAWKSAVKTFCRGLLSIPAASQVPCSSARAVSNGLRPPATLSHNFSLRNHLQMSTWSSPLQYTTQRLLLAARHTRYGVQLPAQQQTRGVVIFSKLGKRKTVKAVAKRFRRTGSGKLKYWPPGKTHNMLAKSRDKRRHLRKARYANKTQLKTLNKMLSGW